MTTKSTMTWKRIGALALSLTLAWGMGPVHTLSGANAASQACGKGDYGLSATLKRAAVWKNNTCNLLTLIFLMIRLDELGVRASDRHLECRMYVAVHIYRAVAIHTA